MSICFGCFAVQFHSFNLKCNITKTRCPRESFKIPCLPVCAPSPSSKFSSFSECLYSLKQQVFIEHLLEAKSHARYAGLPVFKGPCCLVGSPHQPFQSREAVRDVSKPANFLNFGSVVKGWNQTQILGKNLLSFLSPSLFWQMEMEFRCKQLSYFLLSSNFMLPFV